MGASRRFFLEIPLFSLVVAASAGSAFAQSTSSVVIWGLLDADVSHFSQGGLSKTLLSTSGNAGSQLGFRGTEDLGGGMSANFWLESGLLNDTGEIFSSTYFARRSTVSLAGPFGEIRFGRDYTPTWSNHNAFDPFNTSGAGAGSNITTRGSNPMTLIRANNSISYLWGYGPNRPANTGRGVYAQLMYALPENTHGRPALGRYAGGRLGYAEGPINAAIAYSRSEGTPYAADAVAGFSSFKEFSLGAAYDFGVGKLMAHVGTNTSDVPGTKYTHWGIGGRIYAGAGYIPVSYNSIRQSGATGAGADQLAAGYVYFFSKRTAAYATVSHIRNKNKGTWTFSGSNGGDNPGFATAPGFAYGSGTGYDFGIRTSF
ncbi:porin [Variovorax sp. PBL-E5]|uniref:porin n=1 Tax=Variovorax sp. PBL-E5 TaxID=434014 RepID=UPI001317DBED|nr:porin [Variovorax sp. PBL-E5]VTU39566.1 Outer membrane porin protein 32 precursor [Variovorax sp. PBL-E5]